MAVKIRLARTGGRKWPTTAWSWRTRRCPGTGVACVRRDVRPRENGEGRDRRGVVLSWLGKGAQPTETVKSLLKKQGTWKKFQAGKSTTPA